MLLIKRALSPPLIAAITGLLVGLSAIRREFVTTSFYTALQTLGAGYAPVAVLILAGSLARKPKKTEKSQLSKVAVGISATRFVLFPMYAMAILRYVPRLFKTPYAILAMLLEAIMPPAQNSTLFFKPRELTGCCMKRS